MVFGCSGRGSVRGACNNVCERAGIERQTPHCCRHGFATSALHPGFGPKTVAERDGWKDATTALRAYSHAMKDRTLTNALFGRKLTQSILKKVQAMEIKKKIHHDRNLSSGGVPQRGRRPARYSHKCRNDIQRLCDGEMRRDVATIGKLGKRSGGAWPLFGRPRLEPLAHLRYAAGELQT